MKEDFDYERLWKEERDEEEERIKKEVIDKLPRGKPRTGIRGHYLKVLKK